MVKATVPSVPLHVYQFSTFQVVTRIDDDPSHANFGDPTSETFG